MVTAQDILCLFCFRSFAPRGLCFRCMMPTCKGREPDQIYAEARGSAVTVMGRILTPKPRSLLFGPLQEAICDTCQTTSYTHLCPHCHFELPYDIGQTDQRTIAIIGARATGKTHYLASL